MVFYLKSLNSLTYNKRFHLVTRAAVAVIKSTYQGLPSLVRKKFMGSQNFSGNSLITLTITYSR